MTDFLGKLESLFLHQPTAQTVTVPTSSTPVTVSLGGNTAPVIHVEVPPLQSNTITPSAPGTILKHNDWPTQHTVWSTFSHPGTAAWSAQNLVDVPCPWTLHMDKIVLHSIQINKLAAESLKRVLNYIWEQAGKTQEAIEKLHYDRYSGSYNYRPIRGAQALSMHSYGLAIDFDDQENQQHAQHHLFQPDSLIVKAFETEGWTWGGRWGGSSIDSMHFQAAKVH
jgi:hypothetical protein